MSERGEGGQGGAQGGGQSGGQGQGQQGQGYVVKTEFTDAAGKTWTVGSAFTGDENAIRKALAAGQIERPQPT